MPAVSRDDEVEFEERLGLAREREESVPAKYTDDGHLVVWEPHRGSQDRFIRCPIFEVLYHGTRGPGKSDALLMAYAQHVGMGHGPAWKGIIFRRTYPELADIVAKSEKWFRRIFPQAQFNRQRMEWSWPSGETLAFRHMKRPADYWSYHGHEYPFIGWEELTNWATDECYLKMFACCRSSVPGVPRMIRATTNPYGVGTNWLKDRFRLAGQWWRTIVIRDAKDDKGNPEKPRCAIYGHIDENTTLLAADPDYKTTIATSASNPAMREAWLDGSWDIVAGGMFDDVWSARNAVPAFEVPDNWRLDRAFDWGSSKPFAVGWFAQSDGSDLMLKDGRVVSTVRGDLFVVREWYGWNGRPNEGLRMLATDVAKGIVERELMWEWRRRGMPKVNRVVPGPADSSIYTVENGVSIAGDMEQPVRIDGYVYPGVRWTRADKSPGTRKSGWEIMRKLIKAASPEKGLPRERPALFVVAEHCPQFLRTVLSLPRDEKDQDDVDTDAEEHWADAARYRCRLVGGGVKSGTTTGMW